jgi:hypothetical protein
MGRRARQGALHQVLSAVLISGQHVRQTEQLSRPDRDEVGEVSPGVLIHRIISRPHPQRRRRQLQLCRPKIENQKNDF